MVAKELWSVARDKKSLPVVKITYLDRVSILESKKYMVAKELWSVARDKKSLPVVKITYLDRVSSLKSKNIWLLRSYGRLLGTKSHFRL